MLEKDIYSEFAKKYFNVPYSVIRQKVENLCKEYGIVSNVDDIFVIGMRELFDENGNLLEDYAKGKLEYGKKAGLFGDANKESVWASHLGD